MSTSSSTKVKLISPRSASSTPGKVSASAAQVMSVVRRNSPLRYALARGSLYPIRVVACCTQQDLSDDQHQPGRTERPHLLPRYSHRGRKELHREWLGPLGERDSRSEMSGL